MEEPDDLVHVTTLINELTRHLRCSNETKILALVANAAYLLRHEYDWIERRREEAARIGGLLIREAVREDQSVA
jgi:hypothetical protein